MGRLRASTVVGVVVWAAAGLCLAWALMRTFGLERAGLFDLLPHRVLAPGASSHGSAILAAYPLRELQGVEPPGYPFVMPRADIAVPGAASVEAVSVHPVPPTGPDAIDTWEEGLGALPATGAGPLTLLIGDFNATLDHRGGPAVAARLS